MSEQQGGARVAKVVETDAPYASYDYQLVEQPQQIAWLDRGPDGRGEHQTGVLPVGLDCAPFGLLAASVLGQNVYRVSRKRDVPD